MDDLLIYLVLGIVYLIFTVMTKSKKKKRVPPPATPSLPGPVGGPAEAPAAQPTMDDALREIRKALGMEAPPLAAPCPPLSQDRDISGGHPLNTVQPRLLWMTS